MLANEHLAPGDMIFVAMLASDERTPLAFAALKSIAVICDLRTIHMS